MTVFEEIERRCPGITTTYIKGKCPSEFGVKDCMLADGDKLFECSMSCPECWNREYEGDEEVMVCMGILDFKQERRLKESSGDKL